VRERPDADWRPNGKTRQRAITFRLVFVVLAIAGLVVGLLAKRFL
jgi:hypothetical protein